jgi:Flp pilus assembly pilin Flp
MMNFINSAIVNVQATLTVAKDSLADRLGTRSEGQAMVEYGLVLVLVGVAAVVGLTALSGSLYNPNAALSSTPPAAIAWATGATKTPGVFNQIIAVLSGGTKGA